MYTNALPIDDHLCVWPSPFSMAYGSLGASGKFGPPGLPPPHQFEIVHSSTYAYTQPIQCSSQFLCLRPNSSAYQTVHVWNIDTPGSRTHHIDAFGNTIDAVWVDGSDNITKKIHILAQGKIATHGIYETQQNLLQHNADIYRKNTLFTQIDADMQMFARDHTTHHDPAQKAWDLMYAVAKYIVYTPHSTWVHASAMDAFHLQKGVCQDHAHVFLACARSLGIPARYVSGYFYDAEKSYLASHAWVDVFIGDKVFSLDITHQSVTHHAHIRLAHGLDYLSVAPIKGVRYGGGDENMTVSIQITALDTQGMNQ